MIGKILGLVIVMIIIAAVVYSVSAHNNTAQTAQSGYTAPPSGYPASGYIPPNSDPNGNHCGGVSCGDMVGESTN